MASARHRRSNWLVTGGECCTTPMAPMAEFVPSRRPSASRSTSSRRVGNRCTDRLRTMSPCPDRGTWRDRSYAISESAGQTCAPLGGRRGGARRTGAARKPAAGPSSGAGRRSRLLIQYRQIRQQTPCWWCGLGRSRSDPAAAHLSPSADCSVWVTARSPSGPPAQAR
jgi:hypothetical protein